MKLEAMRPFELRQAVRDRLPVFVAFGAIEYHAEHLPLGTDLWIAEGIIQKIEERAPIVIAPSIPVAPTMHWAGRAEDGDIDMPGSALLPYLEAYFDGILACGFRRIYVMLGHQGTFGDPATLVRRAAWNLTEKRASAFPQGWGQHPERIGGTESIFSLVEPVLYDQYCDYSLCAYPERLPVGHAGRGETQLVDALHPGTVALDHLADMPHPLPEWLKDVRQADRENGAYWINFCVDGWVRHLTRHTAD